jgi:hypothetical protein
VAFGIAFGGARDNFQLRRYLGPLSKALGIVRRGKHPANLGDAVRAGGDRRPPLVARWPQLLLARRGGDPARLIPYHLGRRLEILRHQIMNVLEIRSSGAPG